MSGNKTRAIAAPSKWWRGDLLAFDLETTGVDPMEARIVTASVCIITPGAPDERHTWLVDPGVEIPEGAARVHGVTTKRARAEGMQPARAIRDIVSLLAAGVIGNAPICAFNARYDFTVLDRECERHNVPRWWGPHGERLLVVDPYVLDKRVDRFRKGSRKLDAVCAHYGIELTDAHDSCADALAAARLAARLGAEFSSIGDADLGELHAIQVRSAAFQAESLEDYFERIGKAHRVERAWPLVPRPADVPAEMALV